MASRSTPQAKRAAEYPRVGSVSQLPPSPLGWDTPLSQAEAHTCVAPGERCAAGSPDCALTCHSCLELANVTAILLNCTPALAAPIPRAPFTMPTCPSLLQHIPPAHGFFMMQGNVTRRSHSVGGMRLQVTEASDRTGMEARLLKFSNTVPAAGLGPCAPQETKRLSRASWEVPRVPDRDHPLFCMHFLPAPHLLKCHLLQKVLPDLREFVQLRGSLGGQPGGKS